MYILIFLCKKTFCWQKHFLWSRDQNVWHGKTQNTTNCHFGAPFWVKFSYSWKKTEFIFKDLSFIFQNIETEVIYKKTYKHIKIDSRYKHRSRQAAHAGWRVEQLTNCLTKKITLSSVVMVCFMSRSVLEMSSEELWDLVCESSK